MTKVCEAAEAALATESLTFIVEKVIFEKDGWCVVVTRKNQKVVGNMRATVGACYAGMGKWVETKYGPQFDLVSVAPSNFIKGADLARYLAFQVEGIGKNTADVLAEEIGDDLERCLDEADRDRLVDAIGPKKADVLLKAWPNLKPAADMVTPLLSYGLSEALAERLVGQYGPRAIKVVEADPYGLINAMDGIAFLSADKIARKVGIAPTNPVRLKAALTYSILDATNSGNLGIPRAELIKRTNLLVNPAKTEGNKRVLTGVIEVPLALLESTLDSMLTAAMLPAARTADAFSRALQELPDEKGAPAIWAGKLLRAEDAVVSGLSRLKAKPLLSLIPRIPVFAAGAKMTLAPEQHCAVEAALRHSVTIITGGPGCGKSATLKVLLAALDAAGEKGVLTAPTGKAAKRITESTGRIAQTLHSTLGIIKGEPPKYGRGNPLPYTYMVVDEASMVDIELMAMAVQALNQNTRLIIVGDVDQLASVGPGQVLRDLIRSCTLPVTRLTKVFRQGAGSGIIEAAAEIRDGQAPTTTRDQQFVHCDTETPDEAIMAQIQAMLEAGTDPDDIQVLAPFHKGKAGCSALNVAIQSLLNPAVPGMKYTVLRRDSGDIRVGDRVIQNKNNKEYGLVNGDIGLIEDINPTTGSVTLKLADRATPVVLPKEASQHLKLAYAITVHKSQGAEAPVVLVSLDPATAFLLKRNLVYTAVTRGSKKVVLFGPTRTVHLAVRQGEPAEGSRRTLLASKLQKAFGTNASCPPKAEVAMPSLVDDDYF